MVGDPLDRRASQLDLRQRHSASSGHEVELALCLHLEAAEVNVLDLGAIEKLGKEVNHQVLGRSCGHLDFYLEVSFRHRLGHESEHSGRQISDKPGEYGVCRLDAGVGSVGEDLVRQARTPIFCLLDPAPATTLRRTGYPEFSDPPFGVLPGLFYGGQIRPNRPDRKLFDRLAAEAGDSLISLYLPTHVRGAEINQDRIRLKNGISQVDERLETAGWAPNDRSERLASVQSLLEDEEFWRHQEHGLAVFVDEEGETTTASLAYEPAELSFVATVFHLRPLVTSLRITELWTLVLTKGGVRLYLVSNETARRARLDLPESFDDVNWFVDREKQRQRHPDRTGTNRARHGHEGGSDDEDLKRFIRAVSDALPNSGPAPLVVLGDDTLAARFANISDREVVSPANSGIIDVDDPTEIREKAAPVIESFESSQIESQAEEVRHRMGTREAITVLEEGLEAAVAGRISTLVIHRNADPIWGTFDPASLEVSRHDERDEAEVDLLDRLVVHAMATGAEINATDSPVEGHVFVAIPRF